MEDEDATITQGEHKEFTDTWGVPLGTKLEQLGVLLASISDVDLPAATKLVAEEHQRRIHRHKESLAVLMGTPKRRPRSDTGTKRAKKESKSA